MRHLFYCGLVLVAWALGLAPAQAQMAFLPEVRGGIYAHDLGNDLEGSDTWSVFTADSIKDANVELLFSVPDLNAWSPIGEFRPNIGATVNFDGGQSLAYAGLAWTFQLPVVPVFIEASAGGAVLGRLDGSAALDSDVGCPAAFHGSLSAGVMVFPGVSTMLTAEHANDFGLCDTKSAGLTNVGIRLGVRF